MNSITWKDESMKTHLIFQPVMMDFTFGTLYQQKTKKSWDKFSAISTFVDSLEFLLRAPQWAGKIPRPSPPGSSCFRSTLRSEEETAYDTHGGGVDKSKYYLQIFAASHFLGTTIFQKLLRPIVASRAVAASKSCSSRMALSFGLNTWRDGPNLPPPQKKRKAKPQSSPVFLNSNPPNKSPV